MTMICPKCHDVMRSYERNGVTVDQCAECRGIFLDRGELEHLVAAEARFNGHPSAQAPVGRRPDDDRSRDRDRDDRHGSERYERPGYERPSYERPRYDDDDYYKRGKGKKRKKSFLDELFD